MNEHGELLEFAKNAVRAAASIFLARDREYLRQIVGTELGGRETKLAADIVLEEALLATFLPTGLPLLTEESGLIKEDLSNGLRWVIDPLDGSVNYRRNAGPSAVSVALCRNGSPVFGVLYSLNSRELSWGGPGMGAWCEDQAILVSDTNGLDRALVCAGIPARFRTGDRDTVNAYFELITKCSKVRMLGSAASSLLMVARGHADAYYEDRIMLWDVAAGLALVEGAGGVFDLVGTDVRAPYTVLATNGHLELAGTHGR